MRDEKSVLGKLYYKHIDDDKSDADDPSEVCEAEHDHLIDVGWAVAGPELEKKGWRCLDDDAAIPDTDGRPLRKFERLATIQEWVMAEQQVDSEEANFDYLSIVAASAAVWFLLRTVGVSSSAIIWAGISVLALLVAFALGMAAGRHERGNTPKQK